MGSFFFAYAGEVCQEKAMSLAQFSLYVAIIAISLSTESLFSTFGTSATFLIFCILNLLGGLFIAICSKEITGLSKKELEQLYLPESYKRQNDISSDPALGHKGSYSKVLLQHSTTDQSTTHGSTQPTSLITSAAVSEH